jgi:hypothetical protein
MREYVEPGDSRAREYKFVLTIHYLISDYLSIPIKYYLFYGSTALCWTLAAFFSVLIFLHSVGLLGRGISSSQGHYLLTGQQNDRINANRHPCFEWDSNPRPQSSSERRQFMH